MSGNLDRIETSITEHGNEYGIPREHTEGGVDVVHYIVMCIGMFARQNNLTRKDACNYLSKHKGLEFSIKNYEVEHQLSLQDCVDDMAAICQRNGGSTIL